MWWGQHGFWCFGFLLLILLIVFVVVRACAFRNCSGCRRRWSDEAEAILKKRLASGEIDESEYQRLRDALRK